MRVSVRKAAAFAWNQLPLDFDRLAVAVVEDPAASFREPPALNKLCDGRDWLDAEWRRAYDDLGYVLDPGKLHRKEWELAQAVYGLRRLRRLHPDATALGLGSGHEVFVYFLARRLASVVATDLYEGEFADAEADPRMLRDPAWFAPYAYPRERLVVRSMDATTIDYPDESFDLAFSLSSIEHFGDRAAQLRALREIHRVLRPGGVAVLTTEVILNALGFHGDFFRVAELVDRLLPASGLTLAGDSFRFELTRSTMLAPVQLPETEPRFPHLVCRRWRTLFTSGAFFLVRPGEAHVPAARRARVGDEVDAELPVPLAAEIRAERAPAPVSPGERVSVRCQIENRGTAAWDRAAPRGVGAVHLGAHLLSAEGAMLERDLARAELSRDVAPGESLEVEIALTAPPRRDDYTIELDMVKEGIAWFAGSGPSRSVRIPLVVR